MNSGLPIGNLTSQWWGNHYLAALDHFVVRELKVPFYQRYMDDLALMADSAGQLARARDAIARWLWTRRRLQLKHPDAPVIQTTRSVTYLGLRASRAGLAPTRAALRRFQRRVRYLVMNGSKEQVRRSIAAYRGVLRLGPGGV